MFFFMFLFLHFSDGFFSFVLHSFMTLFLRKVIQGFPTHHCSFFLSFLVMLLLSPGLLLPFFLTIVLIFILSRLSCFGLSFPLCHSPISVLLSLHRSITSTPSILLSISLFSVQYMDASSCLWIPSFHILQRLVKTDLKVFWCQ